jgi:hypothetical protein
MAAVRVIVAGNSSHRLTEHTTVQVTFRV